MVDRGYPYPRAHHTSAAGFIVGGFAGLIGTVLLLATELVATMLVYIYLNLKHLETFGWLVKQSRFVLDLLAQQLEYWLPAGSNAAYATLIGELGPKSILLLMIGLVVGSIIRGFLRLFHG